MFEIRIPEQELSAISAEVAQSFGGNVLRYSLTLDTPFVFTASECLTT